jgi:hypothetical protein
VGNCKSDAWYFLELLCEITLSVPVLELNIDLGHLLEQRLQVIHQAQNQLPEQSR